MRFTVKAKLASAFGVIIVLSGVAGGVAYMKLGDMMATADSMVLRANRMEKATQIEKDILLQLRAEKNSILERKPRPSSLRRMRPGFARRRRRPGMRSTRSRAKRAGSCWTALRRPTPG